MKLLRLLVTMALIATPFIGQTSVAELMRRADAAFADENRALAERLYRQVLTLDPYQSRAVYRLGQLSRDDEVALEWFKQYAELEPTDAWGWLAVGDKSLKVGKTVEALEAFERASRLQPKAQDIQERLAKGRLRAAPTIEPIGGLTHDSDGNLTLRYGLGGSMAFRKGLHLGARFVRSNIDDGINAATLDEGVLRLEGRPRMALRLDLTAGLARLAYPDALSWTTPEVDLRVRWREDNSSPSFEARLQRLPLGTSPLLIANHAVRNELRLGVELPAGPVRIKGTGRAGLIETFGEDANLRLQGDAALALPIGWRGEVSAQYHRLSFNRASSAGYFAPKLVESIEGGTYWDLGGDGEVSASVDLGVGIQRLAKQGEEVGVWKLALRGWALLSVDLNRSIQWRVEGEAYSAPFAPVGVVIAPNWRYISASMGLLIRIAPK
jgi:tetratricopeptide (TPR) repeat protein